MADTQTLRVRTRIRVRWETIAVLIIVAAVSFVLGMGTQWRIDNYIPPCTDKIAVEGGICQGPIQ